MTLIIRGRALETLETKSQSAQDLDTLRLLLDECEKAAGNRSIPRDRLRRVRMRLQRKIRRIKGDH